MNVGLCPTISSSTRWAVAVRSSMVHSLRFVFSTLGSGSVSIHFHVHGNSSKLSRYLLRFLYPIRPEVLEPNNWTNVLGILWYHWPADSTVLPAATPK